MSEHTPENDAPAIEAVREVMNLHRSDTEGWCVEDGFTWPCTTARLVSAVMDADDSPISPASSDGGA
jgi:hypothetical protein